MHGWSKYGRLLGKQLSFKSKQSKRKDSILQYSYLLKKDFFVLEIIMDIINAQSVVEMKGKYVLI